MCGRMECSKAHAQAGDAGAVMKRVKTRLDGLSSLSCSFRRVQDWKEMGRSQRIEGTLKLRKPGRLRVEYPAQTIVTDGKTSWTYSPKNNQVTIASAGKGEDAYPTPQTIFRRYSSRKAELAGKEKLAGVSGHRKACAGIGGPCGRHSLDRPQVEFPGENGGKDGERRCRRFGTERCGH